MKTFIILLVSLSGFAAITMTQKVEAQASVAIGVSFNTFYQQLSPYGQWRELPRYGRVWSYSEPGFRPYSTNGQWENTDEGWYWKSNYTWGSIPFHYGRWELDPYYGWIWIPGYDYAPAWVVWSQTADCYGWAPLGFGLDINVSFGRIPANRWMYSSINNIARPRIDRYCIPYERNSYYYSRQRPIVNVYTQRNVRYLSGPHISNHSQPQRPTLRNDRHNSVPYRNDYSYNSRNRPNNNIHFDPSTQYNRNRAIAGSRREAVTGNRGYEFREGREISRQRPESRINQPGMNRQLSHQGGGSGSHNGNRRTFR